jgi:hypothetical protein
MIKLISGEQRNAWLFLAEMVGNETPDMGIFVFLMKVIDVPGIMTWEGGGGRI